MLPLFAFLSRIRARPAGRLSGRGTTSASARWACSCPTSRGRRSTARASIPRCSTSVRALRRVLRAHLHRTRTSRGACGTCTSCGWRSWCSGWCACGATAPGSIVASIPVVFVLGSFGQFNWLRWIYIYVAGGRAVPPVRARDPAAGSGAWHRGRDRVRAAVADRRARRVAAARLSRLARERRACSLLGRSALVVLPILVGACAVVAILAASYRIPGGLEAAARVPRARSRSASTSRISRSWRCGRGCRGGSCRSTSRSPRCVAVGWTLVLGKFRLTATLLLGEPWVRRPRRARRRADGDAVAMPSYPLRALVLRKTKLGETDTILTLLAVGRRPGPGGREGAAQAGWPVRRAARSRTRCATCCCTPGARSRS